MSQFTLNRALKFKLITIITLQSFPMLSHAELSVNQSTSIKQDMNTMNHELTLQQKVIVPIAAFAAIGNIEKLKFSLNYGLDNGLTINEIKAILVQTYAYAGFPRSLNALGAFTQVLEQRKAEGVQDVEGKARNILAKDYNALKQGTQNQTELVGKPVEGPLFEFVPEIDEYLKAHLFGDIFSNDVLTWQDREIATVSMLSALEGVDSQLRSHIMMTQRQGISLKQFQALGLVLADNVNVEASQRFEKELANASIQ